MSIKHGQPLQRRRNAFGCGKPSTLNLGEMKMATVRITEGNQLIMACDISEISSQNEFIRGLVAQAQSASDGMATQEDPEGCLVTSTVSDGDNA